MKMQFAILPQASTSSWPTSIKPATLMLLAQSMDLALVPYCVQPLLAPHGQSLPSPKSAQLLRVKTWLRSKPILPRPATKRGKKPVLNALWLLSGSSVSNTEYIAKLVFCLASDRLKLSYFLKLPRLHRAWKERCMPRPDGSYSSQEGWCVGSFQRKGHKRHVHHSCCKLL